jgi:myo-inositol catabolism protein IolC
VATIPTKGEYDERMTSTILLILASDHRDGLERELYGLTASPTPAEAARISQDKLTVYQALVDAAPELPEGVQAGILVDEQYGAAVAELAARSDGLINLSMPLEASGKEWFEFAYDDWQQHGLFFGNDHAKVLIRDNPEFDASARALQAEKMADLSTWCRQNGRPLIIELLVPATEADLAQVDGDAHRYDDELRPELTLRAIEFLQDHGADPAVWKVEGMDATEDAQAVADLAVRDGREATCIVLGRHSSREDLDRWLEAAAPVANFTGFAIGRSIWWDALVDLRSGSIDRDEAQRRITAEYLAYAKDFLDARPA